MKTLTIIGGSGFVGKSFIDGFNRNKLKKFNIKKINIICRSPKKIKKIKSLNLKKVRLIKGDIERLRALPISDLYIYAAETTNVALYKNAGQIIKKHKKAINNFCKITKKQNLNNILYLSSGIASKANKFHNSKYKKIYSKLKIYSENKIKNLSKNKVKTSIARCYTFVGCWLPKNSHYAIENFINDGLHKKKIFVNSKSKVIRSYMYADDLIVWLTKIVINSNINCPIYDVGSNEKIELRELALRIGKIFNKPIVFKKYKSSKIDKYIPNINKTKKKLKLKIISKLNESIKLSIKGILNEKTN